MAAHVLMISELSGVSVPLSAFKALAIQLISSVLPLCKSGALASSKTKSWLSPHSGMSTYLVP